MDQRQVRSRLPPQPASLGVPVFSGRVGETRAFSRLVGPKTEPETVPAARFGRQRARGLHSRIGGSVWGVRLRLADAKQLSLCRPSNREVHGPNQPMGGQVGRLASRGDRFDNVRRQEGERQHAVDVPIADSFERCEFGDTRPARQSLQGRPLQRAADTRRKNAGVRGLTGAGVRGIQR